MCHLQHQWAFFLRPNRVPQPVNGTAMFYGDILLGSCSPLALVIRSPFGVTQKCRLSEQHMGGLKALDNYRKINMHQELNSEPQVHLTGMLATQPQP